MSYFGTDRRNKIYYELVENPNAFGTLIFLHGWAETHKIWREQLAFFQKDYQILTLDLRGFGLSSKPTYGYSLKLQANLLHNLVQNLNLTNCWLIGHSLGGMITLQYCKKYSTELSGAILIDTTAALPAKLSIWRNLGTFFVSKTLRQIWQRTLKSIKRETQRTLIQELIHDVDSVPLYVSAACGIAVLNFRVRLKEIKSPILIIVGSDDDLTPTDLSVEMHQKLSNSQLKIINNAGHMSFIEKPDEINAIIAQFLLQSK